MYPNLGSGTTQPSAPPPPPSSNLSNSGASRPVGFSSLMSQPNNQSTPYPSGGQSSQTPYPSGQSSGQPPYPTGPPSSSSSSSFNSPYPASNQPPNAGSYSAYSLPNIGTQPPPPQGSILSNQKFIWILFLGGSGYQQNPYTQQAGPYPSSNPSSGYPPGPQQQPPPTG